MNPLSALIKKQSNPYSVFFMRQSGRFLPLFSEGLKANGFKHLLFDLDWVEKLTLLPLEYFSTDFLIIFSDIFYPLLRGNIPIDYTPSGPKLSPSHTIDELILKLKEETPKVLHPEWGPLFSKIKTKGKRPLFGFVGCPVTLTAYLLEGGIKKGAIDGSKTWIFSHPKLWEEWTKALVQLLKKSILEQAEAGADAIYLFESHGGDFSHPQFKRIVNPHLSVLVNYCKDIGIPSILYCAPSLPHLRSLISLNPDGIHLDRPLDSKEREKWVGRGLNPVIIEGLNEDFLFEDQEVQLKILKSLKSSTLEFSTFFSLGNGISPLQNPEQIKYLTEFWHGGSLAKN